MGRCIYINQPRQIGNPRIQAKKVEAHPSAHKSETCREQHVIQKRCCMTIKGFTHEDTIVLQGNPLDYLLLSSGSGTWIFRSDRFSQKFVGFIDGVTDLDLKAAYFQFVE